MKLFQKVIAITLLLISFVYNQVNTEAIRGNNLLPGIHHNLELDFAYISGNTEILNLNGSYRADYVSIPIGMDFLYGNMTVRLKNQKKISLIKDSDI